jgi:hypothetical protein
VTKLRLIGGSFRRCEADEDMVAPIPKTTAFAARRRRRHRVVRSLWANEGGGSWSTSGGYAAATVSGTQWLTEDLCLGTYVFVERGMVVVRDFVRHRTVRLRAGHAYLARSPDLGG